MGYFVRADWTDIEKMCCKGLLRRADITVSAVMVGDYIR